MNVQVTTTQFDEQFQTALQHHQSGDLVNAESLYQQLLQIQPANDDVMQLYGTLKLQQGDTPAARKLLESALQQNPNNSQALINLGNVLSAQADKSEAIALYQRALDHNPDMFQAHSNLGNLFLESSQFDQAEASYNKALQLNPDFEDAINGLGNLRYQQQRYSDAIALHQKALQINSSNPGSHILLAQNYVEVSRSIDALVCYYHALSFNPGSAEAHYGMGNILFSLKRSHDAIQAYQRALQINPAAIQVYNNLGNTYAAIGDLEAAISCLNQVIDADPENAEAWNNLGSAQFKQGKQDLSLESFNKAIAIDPHNVDAYNNLGQTLVKLSRPHDALEPLKKALQLKPNFAPSYYNLGYALNQCGQAEESYQVLRDLLKRQPGMHGAHDTLLFYLSYDYKLTAEQQLEEHKAWGLAHGTPRKKLIKPLRNSADPDRTLKIGYVSPDLANHPVAHMSIANLTAHDKSKFQVHYYSNRTTEDGYSEAFKQEAYKWTNILGMNDNQVANQIRDDGIDILVDLVGHTAASKLTVFAQKPAPVQVSWLGYCDTTGLDAIDYIFMDDLTVPETMNHLFVEEVYRLPSPRFCYSPPGFAPPVAQLPAITNGFITFGSFNNLLKVTPHVVSCWSDILKAVPNSKLLINWLTLREPSRREKLLEQFSALGIAHDRLILLQGNTVHEEVLAQYAKIDIALDTFPYSGGITTAESLWMGIPVVTMLGDRAVSRQSGSIISAAGFPQWVAKDQQEYQRIAIELANNIPQLYNLRKTQRTNIGQSALCNAPVFTAALESAYREIWQRWCKSQG